MFRSLEIKLYRWMKRRRDLRILKHQAKLINKPDSGATERARLWAESVLAGIKARKDICIHCMRPFDLWTPTDGERFRVRAILNIPDRELDPKLCKVCYEKATMVFNEKQNVVGSSNHGPPNLVLRDHYEKFNHG